VGKGRRRVSTSQTTVTVTTRTPKNDSIEGAEAGGAGQSEQQSEPCWTFMLENPNRAAIREVSVGASVQGQPVSSTILVTSSLGALGRAPEGVSRTMIKAQQQNGGNLSGRVVEHQKITVKIQLCLG
jgi:hypothetical protein